jgi:hypothetical protein
MTNWTVEAKNPATWTSDEKNIIVDSFLLLEDGDFLLLQSSDKVVLNYGWVTEAK